MGSVDRAKLAANVRPTMEQMRERVTLWQQNLQACVREKEEKKKKISEVANTIFSLQEKHAKLRENAGLAMMKLKFPEWFNPVTKEIICYGLQSYLHKQRFNRPDQEDPDMDPPTVQVELQNFVDNLNMISQPAYQYLKKILYLPPANEPPPPLVPLSVINYESEGLVNPSTHLKDHSELLFGAVQPPKLQQQLPQQIVLQGAHNLDLQSALQAELQEQHILLQTDPHGNTEHILLQAGDAQNLDMSQILQLHAGDGHDPQHIVFQADSENSESQHIILQAEDGDPNGQIIFQIQEGGDMPIIVTE